MLTPVLLVDFQEFQRRIQGQPPRLLPGATAAIRGVPDGHFEPTRECLLDAPGALENAQPSRDPELIDSKPLGERLRGCEPVLLHQVRVGGALLCWREVLALDVLEQAVESGGLVAELDDFRRNRAPLARRGLFGEELERGAAAVTRDDLETRPCAPYDDAMDEPALENRLGQLLDVVVIDVLPRLVWIVVKQFECHAHVLRA